MRDEPIWIVWPELDISRAEYAKTRFGAEVLSIWVGLKTWIRRNPQRVCIGYVDTP